MISTFAIIRRAFSSSSSYPPLPLPLPLPRRLSLLNARRERALIRRLPKQRRELRLLAKCRGLGAHIIYIYIYIHTHTRAHIYIYIYLPVLLVN